MRLSLVVLSLALTACGGSSSSSSSGTQKKQTTAGTSSANTSPAKGTLALKKFPVANLSQIAFQSIDSNSIPAIKTFE